MFIKSSNIRQVVDLSREDILLAIQRYVHTAYPNASADRTTVIFTGNMGLSIPVSGGSIEMTTSTSSIPPPPAVPQPYIQSLPSNGWPR